MNLSRAEVTGGFFFDKCLQIWRGIRYFDISPELVFRYLLMLCGPTPLNRPTYGQKYFAVSVAFFHFKYHNMKRLALILVLMITSTLVITSCTSSKASSKSGCKTTQGMIGYR